MSQVGFRDLSAGANAPIWQRERLTLPAGQTLVADTHALSSFKGITYIIQFWNDAQAVARSDHVDLVQYNSQVRETVTNRLGANVNVSIKPLVVGSDMTLELTNGEAFDLEVELNRLIMGG